MPERAPPLSGQWPNTRVCYRRLINDADPKVRAYPKFIPKMIHSRHPVLAPLHRLMVFAQSIPVRRMIEGIALDPKQTFWIMTVNLLADTVAVEWCKVFGSWEEATTGHELHQRSSMGTFAPIYSRFLGCRKQLGKSIGIAS